MSNIILNPGREKSLLRRHPWIFSGAVQRVDGNPELGSTVDVLSAKGEFLGKAAFSPHSQIRARIWTFDPSEVVDSDFIRKRIRSSINKRQALNVAQYTDAVRLIHAESDGLPGLIVDRYANTLVTQFLTAGTELWRETITNLLMTETGLPNIFERSDADVRELEGLSLRVGSLLDNPLEILNITEHGLSFRVDIAHGHKTGFYLDQRENRHRARQLAQHRDVLDCFCYTGGFTVNALAGGAKTVTAVDSSAEALILARENVALNRLTEDVEWLEGDVFQTLRKFRNEGRYFDMIILDPPKFAPTNALVKKASRGYKDINLLAFKLLRLGGILITFSCSSGIDAALFQKIVASAALDAGAEAQIIERLSQGADHPVALNFPEGAYLKGLVCLKV